MTQNELYAAFAAVAFIAYSLGRQKAKAVETVTNYDPLGWLSWLNQYTSA
jgi:hypothetical protein